MPRLLAYALALSPTLTLPACQGSPAPPDVPAVLALARPEVVGDLYRRWEAGHAENPSALRIPLHFAKGLSAEPTRAAGLLELDVASGQLSLRVFGLPDGEYDVWLVDNQPGPGRSAQPDPGDRELRAARLLSDAGTAQADLELAPAALRGFQLDRAVLTRAGAPVSAGLLFGSPTAFDRLYTRARRGELDRSVAQELDRLVVRGAELFEQETFGGNGRTCATCHPAANNLTLDPAFIATLPASDALFVAEQVPELAELENAVLLRARALILENVDGFERPGVLRGIPHTLALPTSLTGPELPFDNTRNPAFGIVPPAERTGWGGDGAPGSGTLREFATGAVVQHFTRSLERRAGRDFRLPTDDELDALEVFQLALGRDADSDLGALRLRSPLAARGLEIFNRTDTQGGSVAAGKCGLCHSDAGANLDAEFFTRVLGTPVSGNANFGTGVNELAALPADLLGPAPPRDGGFARVPHDGANCAPARGGFGTVTAEGGALPPGLCEEDFNTPPLVEAADTPPFFHNNAVDSLELAVAFYNDRAFNASAGGQLLAALDSGGVGIRLDASEVAAVAGLLRVLNALENLRVAESLARAALGQRTALAEQRLHQAPVEIDDAVAVLAAAGLHPEAQPALARAREALQSAVRRRRLDPRDTDVRRALDALAVARGALIDAN